MQLWLAPLSTLPLTSWR